MINGYIDIPNLARVEYNKAIKLSERSEVCKIIPRGRFNISEDGKIYFSGLVCSSADMGGEATGVGAEGCMNCLKDD